jgi:CBS domain containing-hemolysin-like protein
MTDKGLEALAQKLGVAVSELWRVAQGLPAYNAMTTGVDLVISLIAFGVLLKVRSWVATKVDPTGWGDTWDVVHVATLVGIVVSGISVVACLSGLGSHLIGMTNPEVYALKLLLSAVR